MGPRIVWPWQLCAAKDIGREIDTRYFKRSFITPKTGNADIQIFLKAHNERNLSEYQGSTDIDPKLLAELIECTQRLEAAVSKLEPPKDDE